MSEQTNKTPGGKGVKAVAQATKKAQSQADIESQIDGDMLSDDETAGTCSQEQRVTELHRHMAEANKKRLAQAESGSQAFKKRVKVRETAFFQSMTEKVKELSSNDADFKTTFKALVDSALFGSSITRLQGQPVNVAQIDYSRHPLSIHQQNLARSSGRILDNINDLNGILREAQEKANNMGSNWTSQDKQTKYKLESLKQAALLEVGGIMGFKSRGITADETHVPQPGGSWKERVVTVQRSVDKATEDLPYFSEEEY